MSQQTLDFDRPPAFADSDRPGYSHRNAGPTETNAALRVRKGRGAKQMRMLAAYYDAPMGLTDFEIEAKCNMLASSVTSCRNSLIENEYVEKTPYTRPGRAMWPVAVWRITAKGRRAHEASARDAGVPPASASRPPRDAA